MTAVTCARFDEHADELALGAVDEPLRSELLGHAAGCTECRALLDGLGSVTDRLLAAAPEVEPPAGFESRALARLGGRVAARRRSRIRLVSVAAAVAVLAAGAIVVAIARDDGAPVAAIVAADDTQVGAVHLVASPRPHVLITIDRPRPGSGTRTCELLAADGSWVAVGSWEVAEIASGVWAAGIDVALLDSSAMRITAEDGTVLATATF